jgi:hypothetical protein
MITVETPEQAAEYMAANRGKVIAVDYGDGIVTIYEVGDKLPAHDG